LVIIFLCAHRKVKGPRAMRDNSFRANQVGGGGRHGRVSRSYLKGAERIAAGMRGPV